MFEDIVRKKINWRLVEAEPKSRKWTLPFDPTGRVLSFATSSRAFLEHVVHFINAFYEQWLYYYALEKDFFFLAYFLDYIVYSYNLFCLLHFFNYNLAGRRRFFRLRNKAYNPSLPKRVVTYREEFYRRWRLKFRKKPRPNVPLVTEPVFVKQRFIGVARSFRILELRAYSQVNNALFDARFFFKKPKRKAVYVFVLNLLHMDITTFLILRSYIFSWFTIRYNEFIGHTLGTRSYTRFPFIRKSRYSYFKTHGMLDFTVVQFAVYFYFGRFLFLRLQQSWDEDKVLVWEMGPIIYKNFFGVLPLLVNPEWLFLMEPAPGNSLRSLFYLESMKYYFMYFCYLLMQYSPKTYGISKCWIQRWVHIFDLSSIFKELMAHFAELFLLAAVNLYTQRSFSSELFLDCQLVDAIAIQRLTGTWGSIWLYQVCELLMVDFLDTLERPQWLGLVRYLDSWERLNHLFIPRPSDHFRFFTVLFFSSRTFNLWELVGDLLPFTFLMYAIWDVIYIDTVRDFFGFRTHFPNFFSRIFFDSFIYDYYSSVNYVSNTIINGFYDARARAAYKGRGRRPKRRKFLVSIRGYLYYFFSRDVVFKFFFLSSLFPLVFYLLIDTYFKALRWRKDKFFLHGQFLGVRRFLSVAHGNEFIPSEEEFFFDPPRWEHMNRFYEVHRSRFYEHWMHKVPPLVKARRPFKVKWLRVYYFDWERKQLLSPNFFFMIYGVPRPRGRLARAPESLTSLPSIVVS